MEQGITWLAVFFGGGLGSLARFGTSVLVVNKFKTQLPIATLIANLLASIVLIYTVNKIAEGGLPGWVKPLVLVGFCGGFSTFSTFSYEVLLLAKSNQWGWALANVAVSVLLCVGFMWVLYKSPVNV
jgi:CrcB protein